MPATATLDDPPARPSPPVAALPSAPATAPPNPQALPLKRKYLIFGILAFGQFMALLDIQIVAASLNDIQAGLSAGPDEISWVQTAYLMAELVMIPFSAFLGQAMSTGFLFATSAALFTLASVACGLAWNIESMIVFRAIQGFVGGAMVPTVFAVGFTIFEERQRAMIPAILGMVSVLAPTIGPTVGGVITEYAGWRWIFLINVVPGALVAGLTVWLVRIDKADASMFGRIDWSHLIAMAVALGGLEYVLEEGPRRDWLGDPTIATVAWVAAVAFALFVERSLYSKNPIVRVSPFRQSTFAVACVFNLVIGFGLYASTYLLPVFLGRVRGFNSLQIGTTVCVVGATQVLSTVLAARASTRLDPRLVIAVGLPGFAGSLWLTSHIAENWGFGELLVPQLARGLFVMLCIVPSVGLALSVFQGPELRAASGLFNLMRNLGGAIGIATVNTWLADAARTQGSRFGAALGEGGAGQGAVEFTQGLTARIGALAGVGPEQGSAMAQALLGRVVGRQALVVAFEEVFRTMAWMFVAALVLVPLCRPPKLPGAKAGGAAAPIDAH